MRGRSTATCGAPGSAAAVRTAQSWSTTTRCLPVRRRFWEHALRAVDRAGTAGLLRTQLRIVYDAIRRTADEPVGTVVPADFLFEALSADLLRSGVLLREIHEVIVRLGADGAPEGKLKSRICSLVFLIRKLPREAGADIGVRATAETLADLLVEDLATDGAALRGRLPALLDELVEAGTLMKLEDEYSLQTREGSDWEAEFRNRKSRIANDAASMAARRASLLGAAVRDATGSVRLLQGTCREPRKLALHLRPDPPPDGGNDVPVWVRDGWGASEGSVLADARAAGPDSPVLHVFVPKSRAKDLARLIAVRSAAADTLDYKGVPSSPEGIEARQGMETRQAEAGNHPASSGGRRRQRSKGCFSAAAASGSKRPCPTRSGRRPAPPWTVSSLGSARPTTPAGRR